MCIKKNFQKILHFVGDMKPGIQLTIPGFELSAFKKNTIFYGTSIVRPTNTM
jgi:hypothetical protein